MNIIFFSIFFLRLIIFGRHQCRFYGDVGQLLRESGQFECWDGDVKRGLLSKELKKDLISVSGNSGPVMSIELGLEEMVVNIVTLCL